MMTKEAVLNGLDMYTKTLQDKLTDKPVIVGRKSSTVEGSMWFSVDDDLYWSLYMCINGARIEIAYGQLKTRA